VHMIQLAHLEGGSLWAHVCRLDIPRLTVSWPLPQYAGTGGRSTHWPNGGKIDKCPQMRTMSDLR